MILLGIVLKVVALLRVLLMSQAPKVVRYITGISFKAYYFPHFESHPDFISQDLNQGSKGRFIYGTKEWTEDPDLAVTEFAFVRQHFSAPSAPWGFTRLNQDLNQGAGGSYNYLCVRRGHRGARVIDIDFVYFFFPYTQQSFTGFKVFPFDLNKGTQEMGRFIYLIYKTE